MTYREHDTSAETGRRCWCNPRTEMICPECDDDPADKAGCWRCGGAGWVECPDPEHYDGPIGLLTIHNDPDGNA